MSGTGITGRGLRVGLMAAVLLAALPAGSAPPSPSQYPGKISVFIPEPTNDGNWDGTWYFNSVDAKIAIWMRTRRSKTEMKLKYESGVGPIGFETDWSGDASYYSYEKPATFRCNLTKTTPDRLEGSWDWDYQLKTRGRSEKGTFTIFRALDGRLMVFDFATYELAETYDGKTGRTTTLPAWTFTKASKFLALWDELPF